VTEQTAKLAAAIEQMISERGRGPGVVKYLTELPSEIPDELAGRA
jgi:hypothetical protein